jgi:hypothetical protein
MAANCIVPISCVAQSPSECSVEGQSRKKCGAVSLGLGQDSPVSAPLCRLVVRGVRVRGRVRIRGMPILRVLSRSGKVRASGSTRGGKGVTTAGYRLPPRSPALRISPCRRRSPHGGFFHFFSLRYYKDCFGAP